MKEIFDFANIINSKNQEMFTLTVNSDTHFSGVVEHHKDILTASAKMRNSLLQKSMQANIIAARLVLILMAAMMLYVFQDIFIMPTLLLPMVYVTLFFPSFSVL